VQRFLGSKYGVFFILGFKILQVNYLLASSVEIQWPKNCGYGNSVIYCGGSFHGYFVYVAIFRPRSSQNHSPQTRDGANIKHNEMHCDSTDMTVTYWYIGLLACAMLVFTGIS
jgi:hypothetical protein